MLVYKINMYHPTTHTQLGQALAAIVGDLCATVAHHAVRLVRAGAMAALFLGVHRRLIGYAVRLDRLVARWHAATLPGPRPSRVGQPRTPRAIRPDAPTLPTGHAWLIRLVQPTAQFIGHLEGFLATPEAQALVQAAPQAGRILRPLCRMLALQPPPWLRLPPRPPRERPRPAPAAAPTPAPTGTSPPSADPFPTPDRPLQPWVLAAARYWRARGG